MTDQGESNSDVFTSRALCGFTALCLIEVIFNGCETHLRVWAASLLAVSLPMLCVFVFTAETEKKSRSHAFYNLLAALLCITGFAVLLYDVAHVLGSVFVISVLVNVWGFARRRPATRS